MEKFIKAKKITHKVVYAEIVTGPGGTAIAEEREFTGEGFINEKKAASTLRKRGVIGRTLNIANTAVTYQMPATKFFENAELAYDKETEEADTAIL